MRFSTSQCFSIAIVALLSVSAQAADSWPQWRGPAQNGVADGAAFPTKWDDEGKSGIVWQRELPGRGGSTPVVSGSTAYLTAGVEGKNQLLALDTNTGKTKWSVAIGDDTGGKHKKGSGSNPSAVVDGDLVYAYFRSGDLGCVDASGDLKWHINLQEKFGEDTLWWDLGSSPTVTKSAVVIAVMQTGPSYLVAYDKETGDQLWKADRTFPVPGDRYEASQSYATPLVVDVDGREVIAVMGGDYLTLHAADSGKQLGKLGGFNPQQEQYWRSISSPVADGNIIVCPYARGETLTAVRMDQLIAGKGKDAIAWFRDDLGSDVPTPAAAAGRLYVIGDKKSRGLFTCVDIKTGETIWETRLEKSRFDFSSSPLVAGNHIYATGENATTFVVGPIDADQPAMVSKNELGDTANFTVASPVPVGSDLLIRSRSHLYRVGK